MQERSAEKIHVYSPPALVAAGHKPVAMMAIGMSFPLLRYRSPCSITIPSRMQQNCVGKWPIWAQRVSSGKRKAAAQIRQACIFLPDVLDRRQTNVEPSLNRLASNDRFGRVVLSQLRRCTTAQVRDRPLNLDTLEPQQWAPNCRPMIGAKGISTHNK